MNRTLFTRAALAAALFVAGQSAVAISGSQPPGHGAGNAAMGGASIALPLDAEAAANNPAGIAAVKPSYSLGLSVFEGKSSSDYLLPGNRLENHTTIAVPTGGVVWRLGDGLSAGVSLAAEGVGADYGRPTLPVPGAGNAKSSLKVAEFIPTLAWQPTPDFALGVALNLVYQQFEMTGVIVPAPVPGGLAPVPSHGVQSATGAGLRLGALWKPAPDWAFGLNLQSRSRMGQLGGYGDDVLAYSHGRIDVPARAGVGMAWNATPALTFAADWERVDYAGIGVMQDPAGFGWKAQSVTRLGAAWALHDTLTLRAGFSRSTHQIPVDRLAQNMMVPSLFDRSVTAGLSWRVVPGSQFDLALEANPRRERAGTGASTGVTLSAQAYFFMIGFQQSF